MEMAFVGVMAVVALGFAVWAVGFWLARVLTGDERDGDSPGRG